MADYYSIITNRGKELEAEAIASGRWIVLTQFVVGDSNGKQVQPDPAQIRLINETYRGGILRIWLCPRTVHTVDGENSFADRCGRFYCP